MEKSFDHKYIVVEGPIGVGKTSLVDLIGREFRFKTVLEVVEENPFLPKFYKEMKNYAFQTQLFFLLNRYKQQQALFQNELFSSGMMADYLFEKDRIFAYVNLDESELVLYEKLYAILKPQVPKPDLVIYLQANTETLIKRIKLRGRAYEKTISHEYLERLNKAYSEYFFRYKETPLLIINTNEIDFVHKTGDFDDLIKTIREMKSGTKYYLPISS